MPGPSFWKNNIQRAEYYRYAIITYGMFFLLSQGYNAYLYSKIQQFTGASPDELVSFLGRDFATLGVIGFLSFAIGVTYFVLKLMWLDRAYLNLGRLGLRQYHGSWKATWGWIIPIGNLWLPYQAVYNCAEEYNRAANSAHGNDYSGGNPGRVVDLWWGAFLVSVLAPFLIAFMNIGKHPISKLQDWMSMWRLIALAGGVAHIILEYRMLQVLHSAEVEAANQIHLRLRKAQELHPENPSESDNLAI